MLHIPSKSLLSARLLCLSLLFALLSFTLSANAFAEDLQPKADSSAKISSENYEEIAAMRILEREHLSDKERSHQRLEMGHGVPPLDRLALDGTSPLALLGAQPSSNPTEVSSEEFAEALKTVQRDLEHLRTQEAQNDGHPTVLPFGIDCLDEPSVQEFLAIFTRPGSRTYRIWLQRSGKWSAIITPILEEEGVPADLLYLAMIESGYKNRVRSYANAGGMWQFIPSTALGSGLKINEYVDERFDPAKATRAAARHLRKQYHRFESWPLAMAAYNGGAGTVRKAIRVFNSNDYFKLVEYGAMYRETRQYAPKILAAALIAKNPKAFGFEGLQLQAPLQVDEVSVPGGVRLSLFADAAKCSLDDLRDLNPELLKDETPPYEEHYTLRIPQGTRKLFIQRYDNLSKRYGDQHKRYKLRFGETLRDVAKNHSIPLRVLRQINGYQRRERAPYGSEVLIPTKGRGDAKKASKKTDEKPLVLLPAGPGFAFPDREHVFYKINKGDTLEEIAAHLSLRPTQIALWNDLEPSARLLSTMTLQLFVSPSVDLSTIIIQRRDDVRALRIGSPEHLALGKGSSKSKRGKGSRNINYKVRRNDTVGRIASKFGVSVKDIIRWNNLNKKAAIKPGMRLVIKTSSSKKSSKKSKKKRSSKRSKKKSRKKSSKKSRKKSRKKKSRKKSRKKKK